MARPALRSCELKDALRAVRGELGTVAAFSAASNLLMLVPTVYLLQVYDRVLASHSELTLLAVSLIALFLLALMATLEWARARVLVRAGARLDTRLGGRVFDGCIEQGLRGAAPAAAAQACDDLLRLRQFIAGPGVLALLDAPWIPVYVVVAYVLHPLLGVVALAFVLLQAALAALSHAGSVPAAQAAARARARLSGDVHDKLRDADFCHATGMLPHLRRRWREAQDRSLAWAWASQRLDHRARAASKLLRGLQQSLALAAGALLVIHGELTPGAMIAANLLVLRALAPMDQLVALWPEWGAAAAALDRLDRLVQAARGGRGEAADLKAAGAIELRGVSAARGGMGEPVLRDISLRIEPGSLVTVLGPSGSGKTTLARLLLGLWPDHSGEVLLDGRPLHEWDRGSLGAQLGYLPQDVQLLDGSVAANIARMQPGPPERVIAAARLAGLHEAILRLPEGYDTRVGDAGRRLSGGQRQRVALARALYGDPALVVLDEPDAHLDEAGEAALRAALRDLKARGRTVVIATHPRTGLAALADQVLLLRDGQLAACGERNAVLALARTGTQPAAGAAVQPA